MEQLHIGKCRDKAERHSVLQGITQMVHSALRPDDASLLSIEALWMIFDNWKGSIRHAGNEVAHQAPLSDLSVAISEGNLTPAQSATLAHIYMFTHDEEPQI
jgi:hypothetical protein